MDNNQIIKNAINYILEVPSNQPPKVSLMIIQQLESLLKPEENTDAKP
jgi:hypothetical protein